MRCPSCGNEVSERDDYCWHCGHEFDSQGAAETGDDGTEEDGVTWGTKEETTEEDDAAWETEEESADISVGGDNALAPLTHLLAFFTWVFGPLAVLLLTEDDFVKKNAKNALNWQISLSVYMFASIFLALLFIGILTAMLAALLNLVFCVVAAVKSADGEAWEYPITFDVV